MAVGDDFPIGDLIAVGDERALATCLLADGGAPDLRVQTGQESPVACNRRAKPAQVKDERCKDKSRLVLEDAEDDQAGEDGDPAEFDDGENVDADHGERGQWKNQRPQSPAQRSEADHEDEEACNGVLDVIPEAHEMPITPRVWPEFSAFPG